MVTLRPGCPHPLGATPDPAGTNFALFSAHATQVELCLFDPAGQERRLVLPDHTDGVWHGYLDGAGPGTAYGYRVHGPWAPEAGHRFNPAKLLLDPYARAHTGPVHLVPELYGHHREGGDDRIMDNRDSAPFMPRGLVTAPTPPAARHPVPWDRTIVYELHVAGYTRRHPAVPPADRGRFAGLHAPAVLDHLQRLGVTTVELLPVHAFLDDQALIDRGLSNYWGYNTYGFFAPDGRYATGPAPGASAELRDAVARLHDAGLEVILDVVFNHTAEGDETGPTLSFRGIDNASYYRLPPDRRLYVNDTGCGNTVNVSHPRVLQLVMDSLRHWVDATGIDGFRFDLAPVLGRDGEGGFSSRAAFLQAVGQDPVLAQVKLIAEPWDLGPDGYRLGAFPPGWAEWNDRFRRTTRSAWRGDAGCIPDLATRLSGSADLFSEGGRRPWASVNYVCSHDGFTLRDLVSYGTKHNESNGENNRDGTDNNISGNHGTEGGTDDPSILAARARTMRNLLATLLLGQGTPMLLAGDELGRTQGGNNNPYCQDNETSWLDWTPPPWAATLPGFVADLVRLRQQHPALRRPRFFEGDHAREVTWLSPTGPLRDAGWQDLGLRCLGMMIDGGPGGTTVLLVANTGNSDTAFPLPPGPWTLRLDTATPTPTPARTLAPATTSLPVAARSLVLLLRA